MLKLLWSWILLVVMVSSLMLYKPGLLSSLVTFNFNGSQFNMQFWVLLFIMLMIIILVLTLSNFIFYWQRRIIIQRCKKLLVGVRAMEELMLGLKNDAKEKDIIKAIKQSPVPKKSKNILLKSFMQETDANAGSVFCLWWHGHWHSLAEKLLISEIKSTWKMNLCCHILLAGALPNSCQQAFLISWQVHAKNMLRFFPTIASAVQLQILSFCGTPDELLKYWQLVPKKMRKEEQFLLAYAKACLKLNAWSIFDSAEAIVKSDLLLEWYAESLPAKLFDITLLQKWLKIKPGSKHILLALARAYADAGDWSTVEKLIDEVKDSALTNSLKLRQLVYANDLQGLKVFLANK